MFDKLKTNHNKFKKIQFIRQYSDKPKLVLFKTSVKRYNVYINNININYS